jgi:hypothetical protein
MTEDGLQRFNVGAGYRIADAANVALPVYEVTVRALTLAHKPLAAIEEFVLRSMRAGLSSREEIAEFLGLDDYPLRRALVSLAQQELIALTAFEGLQSWRMTDKGITAVESAELIMPEERMFRIRFDAILWKPVRYSHLPQLKSDELEENGLRAIELVPPRRPRVADLKAGAIERIVDEIRSPGTPRRDVLSVLEVQRVKKYYVPAVAVLYRAWEDAEFHIGFMIDGQRSEEYELRFAASEAFARLSSEWAEVSVDDAELADALEEAAHYERNASLSEVRGALRLLESQLSSTSDGNGKVDDEVTKLKMEIERLKAELQKPDVRYLEMLEHPPLLNDAISTASQRLMIISPWMTTEVVNDDFVARLESTLKRGVQVLIGYGMNDQLGETANLASKAEKARGRLRALSSQYTNLSFVRLGATHSKVLVKDDEFAVITSFNWLSFRGDPGKRLRDEQGVLVQRASRVNEKWDKQVVRFV